MLSNEPRFVEMQRPGAWILAAVLAPSFVVLPLFSWGLYQQLVLGKPFGNQPMSDGKLILVSTVAILLMAAVAALFVFARLETRVYDDRVVVRYRPFHLRGRMIAVTDIASVEARLYRPIIEYGGWGIRYNAAGIAYSMSGDTGVYLTLHDGRGVLIGSKRYEELAAAIHGRL